MLRLAIRVSRDDAELVLAELLDLAPGGVEEVDVDADTVEYAVYGAEGELPELPDLRAAAAGAGGTLVSVSTTEVADDWAERWRAFHRPLVIERDGVPGLTVRPPWEVPAQTGLDVVIDPGRAFGTGAHATTALCLELLLDGAERADGGKLGSCVDLGCGSGVLSIVAALLGHEPVLALDYDPVAVEATAENAARAQVSIDVRRFDLRQQQVPAADLVLANVLAGPLLGWAGSQRLLPPRLVLSGLLITEADRVSGAYARRGMREAERRTRGEWAALALVRTD